MTGFLCPNQPVVLPVSSKSRMEFLNYQLHSLQGLTENPLAIGILALLIISIPIAIFVFDRFKWFVLALLLYVSGLGRPRELKFPPLIAPLRPLETPSRLLMTF